MTPAIAPERLGRLGAKSAIARKLFRGGLPAVASSAITALIPLIGSLFLSAPEYAVWALGATLVTIFVVVDFGATPLSIKFASEYRLSRTAFWRLALITMVPPLILGAVAVAIWPFYAQAAKLIWVAPASVISLFLLVTVGTSLRSLGGLYASIALGRSRFGARSAILVTGAVVQFASTLGGLASGAGMISLGIGVLASGIAQSVIGALTAGKSDDVQEVDRSELARTFKAFAQSKSAVSLIGLSITQLDRWALGFVATPAVLGAYDIASRFASMPKIALIALASGLIAEAGGGQSRQAIRNLLRNAQRMNIFAAVLGGLCAALIASVMVMNKAGSNELFALVLVVVAAHTANSMTIAPSMILSGVGRPRLELRYIVPLGVLCGIAYGSGIISRSSTVLVAIWGSAMIVCSLWFVVRGKSYVLGRKYA